MSLPAAAYAEGDQFQLERRTLFARQWLPFCATAQLGETGAFVSHTLGGWALFAIRGEDGILRAFRNSCRHQNMPVIDKPAGRCEALRCRFHGWTYDLAGALISAPPLVAPPDMNDERNRLEAIELRDVGGFVWVRVERSDAAEDVPLIIDAPRSLLAATSIDLACNWKTLVEFLQAQSGWRYLWPLAFLQQTNGIDVIRQIVPRSFARTRMVDHAFGAADTNASPFDALESAAQRDKDGAEALQARLASGAGGADHAAITEFHRLLAAASA
jgi:nitrite reductase/ring-hydroxylating ferredoxin subunit